MEMEVNMSDEYIIKFSSNEGDAKLVLNNLRNAKFFSFEDEKIIELRDLNIKNSWKYDVRFHKNYPYMIMAIAAYSHELYQCIKQSFQKTNYILTDIDDSEVTTLEEVFKEY